MNERGLVLMGVNEPGIGPDSPDRCPVGVDLSTCSADRLGHGTLYGSLVPRGTQVLPGPKGTDTSMFGVLVFISNYDFETVFEQVCGLSFHMSAKSFMDSLLSCNVVALKWSFISLH